VDEGGEERAFSDLLANGLQKRKIELLPERIAKKKGRVPRRKKRDLAKRDSRSIHE